MRTSQQSSYEVADILQTSRLLRNYWKVCAMLAVTQSNFSHNRVAKKLRMRFARVAQGMPI